MSSAANIKHGIRATTGKKRGKFVSAKIKKKSDALVVENKRRKSEVIEECVSKSGARRVVDIETLAQELWCSGCDIPLSFRYREKEQQFGLVHVYSIRCMKCSHLFDVHTNSYKKDERNHNIYDLNVLTALAATRTGTGLSKLNGILGVLDVPTPTQNFIRRYERKVNTAIEAVAKESFRSVIQKEKIIHEEPIITKAEDTQSDKALLNLESS